VDVCEGGGGGRRGRGLLRLAGLVVVAAVPPLLMRLSRLPGSRYGAHCGGGSGLVKRVPFPLTPLYSTAAVCCHF
jgi:hypothetical protein